jgi:hypothetical protein
MLLGKGFHGLPQAHDFLVLLQQHGQQGNLERQGVRSVGNGGRVPAGGGEQFVQHQLVAAAQGAAEAPERLLLLKQVLIGRRNRAAHGLLPQPQLLRRGRLGLRLPHGAGGFQKHFHQEGALPRFDRREDAHDHRRDRVGLSQVADGVAEQPAALLVVNAFIVKGVQQIQHENGAAAIVQAVQHGFHLGAGEGAGNVDSAQNLLHPLGLAPDDAVQGEHVEKVAAVHHAHRVVQGQVGNEREHVLDAVARIGQHHEVITLDLLQ